MHLPEAYQVLWLYDPVVPKALLLISRSQILYAFEHLDSTKIVLPIQVFFTDRTRSTASILLKNYGIASCLILFYDMVPHVISLAEFRDRCSSVFSRDMQELPRFELTASNVKWLGKQRVNGSEGIMLRLHTMWISPPKVEPHVLVIAKDVSGSVGHRDTFQGTQSSWSLKTI